MEQEIIVNEHCKQEYPPMHTGGIGTPLTYWGVLCFLTALILFAGCASQSKAAKNNGFCPFLSRYAESFPEKTLKHTVYNSPIFLYNKENVIVCTKLLFAV
jgi:hypothetical protein